MHENKQIPVRRVVRAVILGVVAAGLLSLGHVLVYLSELRFMTAGYGVLISGIGLMLYAAYRTLRARLNSPWIVTLLTAFTVKTVFQEQATTLAQNWVALYARGLDPATEWLMVLSGVGAIGLAAMAGVVIGTADAR